MQKYSLHRSSRVRAQKDPLLRTDQLKNFVDIFRIFNQIHDKRSEDRHKSSDKVDHGNADLSERAAMVKE